MDTEMAVDCPDCGEAVLATVVGEMENRPHPRDGIPERYRLVRCTRGGHAILVIQEDYGAGQGYDDRPYRLYPPQRRIVSNNVPSPLREEFNQALQCFGTKAYTAAAVMVGRTLEGVCADQGIRDKTLHRALKVMNERGLIDGRLLEWAQALRVLRNEGAHYTGNQVNRADAEDALAFAEAMLDYVYVLTARFEAFKARRQAEEEPLEEI